jgi:hypothetical protein
MYGEYFIINLKQDTGYYDITNYISSGDNTLKFQMYNSGPWVYMGI